MKLVIKAPAPPTPLYLEDAEWGKWLGDLEKAVFPVGTMRVWKDGLRWQKVGPRKWQKVPGGEKNLVVMGARMKQKITQLRKNLEVTGDKLRPNDTRSFESHCIEAMQVQARHQSSFSRNYARFKVLAPAGAKVGGRVKTVESILGKLVRVPTYTGAAAMGDVSGFRVTVDTIAEVGQVVNAVKKQVVVKEIDDKVRAPGEGHYRSVHIQFVEDGVEKELQIRTRNQDKHAVWMHSIYKPEQAAQKDWVYRFGASLKAYASEVSDYFYAQDQGIKAKKPDCPPVVHQTFGCL